MEDLEWSLGLALVGLLAPLMVWGLGVTLDPSIYSLCSRQPSPSK